MVLHDGEDDLVPLPDPHAAEGIRHEVVGFRGRLGEDDLVDGFGVEEGRTVSRARSKPSVAALAM